MINLILSPEKPAQLEKKAEEAWNRSLYVWEARYGSVPGEQDHIAYLGLVPLDYVTKIGYWWFQLDTDKVTRGMLREAKEVFALLNERLDWTTYAHTEVKNKKATKFATFFDFVLLRKMNEQNYLKRSP